MSMSSAVAHESQRAHQKEQTRERLLRAALKLVESRGFVGLRTQELADRVGVSQGLVFAHFGSRDELVYVLASRLLSQIDQRTRRCLRESRTLEELLRAQLAAIESFERLYTRLIQEKHLLPKRVQALVVEIDSAVSSHLAELLERERRAAALPAYMVFNLWIGLVHHYLLNARLFADGRSVLEERGEELVACFLKLVPSVPKKKE
jgi:AcrR family transcriptional regulator